MGDDAAPAPPSSAASDDPLDVPTPRHEMVQSICTHSLAQSQQLTDVLMQLIQGEQELRASVAELRKGHGDELAALRAELKRFREDTNAELDSMKEGQEKLTAN